MTHHTRSRYAAAAFVVLLLLSIVWPVPIVSVNQLWLHQDLPVDDLSFLGREAPSWDVIFWCMAGLFAIAVVHSSNASMSDWRAVGREIRSIRIALPRRILLFLPGLAAIIAVMWLGVDAPLVAIAERVQSDTVESIIRVFNRLAGGMNPPMIVLFFLIAGVAYRRDRWMRIGMAMALASLSAGLIAQILKFIVGRTRPELWLGPFHYVRGTANSFPSGHTVAAFALGGVLLFASRSVILRTIAVLLACAVAGARVLAFRHWPSDVVASALIALLAAWIATAVVTSVTRRTEDAV